MEKETKKEKEKILLWVAECQPKVILINGKQ